MKDEKHQDHLAQDETIFNLDLPDGEAELAQGGSGISSKLGCVSELSITKRVDKGSNDLR